MKKLITIHFFFTVSSFFLSLYAAGESGRLRYGVLDNGLTYYVRHSGLQKGEVSFYLMQNVGAILEEEHENGMAHFLEHMAFNATRHFPEGVMATLKRKGISTFNASTGVNETIYNIENIPVGNTGLADTCLLILRDWCDGILLTAGDVEKERGIIIEEWRGRAGLERRMMEQSAPLIYNHSKYADRNIIGNLELLQNFHSDVLRDFYASWYRPDLQAVVVIGDIDEEVWEEKIKELFSSIPVKPNLPERYEVSIEDREEFAYGLNLDPENRSVSISVSKRVLRKDYANEDERRRYNLCVNIFNSLFRKRIARVVNAGEEEFLAVSVQFTPFVRNYNICQFMLLPYYQKDEAAFRQVWTLWEEIRRHGFTEEEFDHDQRSLYEQYKLTQLQADQFDNQFYFTNIKNHFFMGVPLRDIGEEFEDILEGILELTVDDVNEWISSWADDKNWVFIVEGNRRDYPYLGEEEIRTIVSELREKDDISVRRERTAKPLIDFTIKPGKLKKTEKLDRFGAEIWTLSNGAKVVYKYVESGKGVFSLAASSHGGLSVVGAEDIPSLTAMTALLLKSGLYHHNRNDLQDIVGGKNIRMNQMVNELTEGIGGSTPTEYAELFFQFLYLLFEKPVFAREQFDKYIQQTEYRLEHTPVTSLDRLNDTINRLMYKESERIIPFDTNYLKRMDFSRVEGLYRERFSNAADFTFCIVGDIEREKALELSCHYIGALPSDKKKRERFIVRDFQSEEELIRRAFMAELPEGKGIVMLTYLNKLKLSVKEELCFSILASVLEKRYFRSLREEQSGTYGVSVQEEHTNWPRSIQTLAIRFETERDRTAPLKKLLYEELEKVTVRVEEEEIRDVIISMKRDRERFAEQMDMTYWLSVLNNYIEMGIDTTSPDYFEHIIDTINAEDISEIARKFLQSAKLRDIVILSENN